jgi:hypothetical protein
MNSLKIFFSCMLLALFLLVGCDLSPYLKASGNYAKALDDSISALRSMKDYNSQMCQQRVQLDYLFHRIEDKKSGKAPTYWADYSKKFKYPVIQTDGTEVDQNWDTHCKQIQISDDIVNKALSGLSAYANALNTIATKDYSGANIKSLATDAINLTGKLNIPSKVTDIAKALSDPLAQLSGVLLMKYAEGKVEKIVEEADPSVTNILDVIGIYIDALTEEEFAVENEMKDTINAADSGLSGDAMENLKFNELVSRWTSNLQTKRDAMQSISGALKKLRDAEKALVTAGNKPDPNTAEELKTVLANAAIVIGDIQALNNAIQGKGGTSK